MKKAIIFFLLLVFFGKCTIKQNEMESFENPTFDFSFEKVKLFQVDSFKIEKRKLILSSSCSAFEINFPTDLSIVNQIFYKNLNQIKQVEIDSVKVFVNYTVHGGQGICVYTKDQILKLEKELDSNQVFYYSKVLDLMYSDTLLYQYSNELAVEMCFQLFGNENIFENSRYFDCFNYFMKINNELVGNFEYKPNYDAWLKNEEKMKKLRPNHPVLKRIAEISKIFALKKL